MLLAGDIGGTKTLLGLFDPLPVRPRPILVREFSTLDYRDLETMVSAFVSEEAVKRVSIGCACLGVAGPVTGRAATLTNVPWRVEGEVIARAFSVSRVAILNDLQAMAYGVPVLQEHELFVLQEGQPLPDGNMALIAAGTGLGVALLHNVNGQFVPSPSESGHADWAARTDRDIGLLRGLIQRFGRASVEHVISGRGLQNLHRLTHEEQCPALPGDADDNPDAPAIISKAALDRSCPGCIEAFEVFVEAYGAEAGNLALRSVSTGGLFVGGGIAPKILPALQDGRFLDAFNGKAPFEDMLRRMPVKVILNDQVGLLGAAVYAATLDAQFTIDN